MLKAIKKNYEILLVLLFFSILSFIKILKNPLPLWDEAVYIGMGKSLYSLGKSGIWEIIRPILLPLFLGGIWKLKLNTLLFSRILGLLFSLGNILLVYLISKKLFNKQIAILSSVLLALTPFFINYSAKILTTIPSTFFTLLAVYFFINNRLVLSGIFSSLAFLFRFPQGLIVLPMLLTLSIKKTSFLKKSKIYLSSFLLVLTPFLLFNYFIYKDNVSKIYHAILRPFILAQVHQYSPYYNHSIFYYPITIFKENYFLIFSLLALFYFFKNKQYKDPKKTLIFLIPIIYLLYFTYITNKQLRFSLSFLPYLTIISAYAIYELIKKKNYLPKTVILIAFVLLMLTNIYIELPISPYRSPIEEEFYKYFHNNPIKGTVLTTDPVPVVYIDNKLQGFYDPEDNPEKAYERLKSEAIAIIYTPRSFPCLTKECEAEKEKLFQKMKEENELVFHKQYWEEDYYIFLRPGNK